MLCNFLWNSNCYTDVLQWKQNYGTAI